MYVIRELDSGLIKTKLSMKEKNSVQATIVTCKYLGIQKSSGGGGNPRTHKSYHQTKLLTLYTVHGHTVYSVYCTYKYMHILYTYCTLGQEF